MSKCCAFRAGGVPMAKRVRCRLRMVQLHCSSARPEGGAGAGPDVLAFRADAGRRARAPRFNVRRDLNSLLSLAGPAPGVAAAGAAAPARIPGPPLQGQRVLARPRAALRRPPSWSATASGAAPTKKARCSSTWTNTPRTSPRTCCRCWPSPATGSRHALKKQSTLVEKNIDALAGLLQLNQAERALLLYGTLARYQRDLRSHAGGVQGQQRARGLCRDRRGGRREGQRGGRGAARRLAAGAHRPGREPDLRAQHHRPGRPDEGQRETAAGADARVPRPDRADGGVHPPGRRAAAWA